MREHFAPFDENRCAPIRDARTWQARTLRPLALILLLLLLCAPASASEEAHSAEAERYWPQWRGPLGTGVAPHATPPIEWSETKNVRWKVEIPGKGHSTPIVWGDRIFVTTAIAHGERVKAARDRAPGVHDNFAFTRPQKFVVLALDRADGRILWQRTVREELPHESGHVTSSQASNSPVTDGERLYAFFGSRGLYCLDLDGKSIWEFDLGQMLTIHAHGEGASPALHGETLVVNWDHEGQSFVIAFDKRTGRERWRVARNEVTSWATPVIVEVGGRAQVIVSGSMRVRGYDLATGETIWECGGLSRNIVASPIAAGGVAYVGSSYDTRAIMAIELEGARGDITGTDKVLWTRRQSTPYVPSPLLYGDALFYLRHYQGILSRVDTKTGEDAGGPFRLGTIRNVYASPVGAAGRIYVVSLEGATLVIGNGPEPEVLAFNQLDESFSASPALAGGEIYLRGERHLYSIAEP